MTKKLKTVFMGTPEFSVPTLIEVAKHTDCVAVYTQPDKPVGRGLEIFETPVKIKAKSLGIPVFQPEKISTEEEIERLKSFDLDAIIVVAYGQILKQKVIDLSKLGCINIHASLLPRWRGAAPIQWAILSGDTKTGVSIMKIELKLDAGPVLEKIETPIESSDTAKTLHDRLSQLGADHIISTLQNYAAGKISPKPQIEFDSDGKPLVAYASKLTKEMEFLDPTHTARELDFQIRALSPWPGTSIFIPERLKIKKTKLHENLNGKPGTLFQQAGMLLLGTTNGCLELLEVQPEGKKPQKAFEFINGLKGKKIELPLAITKKEEVLK